VPDVKRFIPEMVLHRPLTFHMPTSVAADSDCNGSANNRTSVFCKQYSVLRMDMVTSRRKQVL
jgi:hypothetical protein